MLVGGYHRDEALFEREPSAILESFLLLEQHPLPASRYRRYAAVLQSVFIALSLMPVRVLPKSDMTAALVLIPVLAGFLRDWLTFDRQGLRAWSSE